MKSHHQEILKLGIDKLFNERSSFSICSVDNLAELLGVNAQWHPDYKYLRTLHCVDYSSMSSELKSNLPQMVMAVLSQKVDSDLMVKALLAVKSGEIKDLPNTEDDIPTRNLRLANR